MRREMICHLLAAAIVVAIPLLVELWAWLKERRAQKRWEAGRD